MNIEYIIIQAGGKGTRLEYLTQNRPKAIVPVNNRPIIFHMFEKYPKAKFIIIGDYKFDVLQAYLETFADVSYMLIRADGDGNACGVKKALQYIPENVPFVVMWSDLLLDDTVNFFDIKADCYIGITNEFSCSWKFENDILEKVATDKNGVAGFFVFANKEKMSDLPETGSFTRWLQNKKIKKVSINLRESREVGSLKAIKEVDCSNQNRCRPYNKMTFLEDKVIKEGLTKEGKELIEREVIWYNAVMQHGFKGIPHIYSLNPLTMSKIDGDNIFKGTFSEEYKKEILNNLISTLKNLHQMEKYEANVYDMQEDYYKKTIKRLNGIRNVIPFSEQVYININGMKCKNIFFFKDDFQSMVNVLLNENVEFGIIHGDGTLTNTMIDSNGDIYFIDARGYFGKTPLIGDVYYDWAKLYYSIEGAFDQFNIKNFDITIGEKEVTYKIAKSGWEQFTSYLFNQIPNCNEFRVKMIHSIIWLSLASHCWEDYDSMCLAFYNGIYLWNELMQEEKNE